MDHGHAFHGAQIYEEAVRVPFVARWPGRIAAGGSVAAPAPVTDLGGALERLALGDGASPEAAGATLAAAMLGASGPGGDEPVFFYRRHYEKGELPGGLAVEGEGFGMRAGKWKWIEVPAEGRRELYDLATDPDELINLAEAEPARAAAMAKSVLRWRAEAEAARLAWQSAAGVEGGHAVELDDEARARLEALGYVE
jgi:arylsulfatase A-like enzyme